MKCRKLRVVWSVVVGSLCVLLIVLWARSYRYDKVGQLHGEQVRWVSLNNRLFIAWSKLGAVHLCVARPASSGVAWDSHFAAGRLLGFGVLNEATSTALRLPDWFILVALCSGVVFPWTPYFKLQFSLRMLLAAMSVVAVVLGLIVYAAAK